MIKLIREKILEEEKLKLVQEKLALRNMVERYEAEERRRNFEIREQVSDPDFRTGSSSEVRFQTIFIRIVYILCSCVTKFLAGKIIEPICTISKAIDQ